MAGAAGLGLPQPSLENLGSLQLSWAQTPVRVWMGVLAVFFWGHFPRSAPVCRARPREQATAGGRNVSAAYSG